MPFSRFTFLIEHRYLHVVCVVTGKELNKEEMEHLASLACVIHEMEDQRSYEYTNQTRLDVFIHLFPLMQSCFFGPGCLG
jgi:hypothetical protein